MSDPIAPRTLDEADYQICVARSLGLTWLEVAKFIETPAFPTGMSDKGCRNRYENAKPVFDRLIAKFAGRIRREQEAFEELTKQQYRDKLAKLRDKAYRVKERALDAGLESDEFLPLAAKVADTIEDRDFGKAKQVVENTGDVTHNLVWTSQTAQQLWAQERDILASDDLLNLLPGEVLEAEIVAPS